jgi:hypothetical protein
LLHLLWAEDGVSRNISFALTTPQFIDGSKDVTRRNGWLFARVDDVLCAVEKSQGLGKGGKIKKLRMIVLLDVRREQLRRLTDDLDYGFAETTREGFPEGHPLHDPSAFVDFFCASHKKVTPESIITRLEFRRR